METPTQQIIEELYRRIDTLDDYAKKLKPKDRAVFDALAVRMFLAPTHESAPKNSQVRKQTAYDGYTLNVFLYDLLSNVVDDVPSPLTESKSALVRALLEAYLSKAHPTLWEDLARRPQYVGKGPL